MLRLPDFEHLAPRSLEAASGRVGPTRLLDYSLAAINRVDPPWMSADAAAP